MQFSGLGSGARSEAQLPSVLNSPGASSLHPGLAPASRPSLGPDNNDRELLSTLTHSPELKLQINNILARTDVSENKKVELIASLLNKSTGGASTSLLS
jgi:hypothetical protein